MKAKCDLALTPYIACNAMPTYCTP
eukprot:SAG11_NODE_6758_length_1253_cov_1.295494_2_plen_24_part_01